MKINITYPEVSKSNFKRRKFLSVMKWIFLVSAIACVMVNIFVGGVIWAPIVLMSLYSLWHLILSIDLIEYNRISQCIKVSIYSCILMVLIDFFLVGGWALDVINIISFSSIIISGILFFTDFNRQKQNMIPMLYLIVIALIWSIIGLVLQLDVMSWPLIVLGGVAIVLLVVIIIILRGEFVREIRCRFHTR